MDTPNQQQVAKKIVIRSSTGNACIVVLVAVLAACSSTEPTDPEDVSAVSVDDPVGGQEDVTRVPLFLQQLEDDPGLLNGIPDVVASETLADSGLQIAYTHISQKAAGLNADIEAQWIYMQQCTGQVAPAPLVVVIMGPVKPFTSNDDVIRDIDGTPTASASWHSGAIVQISESDFDGSLGNPAFNLRSILGRYLWLSASLPERDYPYSCARSAPAVAL